MTPLTLADSALEYSVAGAMLLLALALGLAALGVNRWLSRRVGCALQPTPPPEFGGHSQHKTWTQFRLRYALVALLFVAFDMEMVYMFPWAVAFRRAGMVGLVDMVVFVLILVSALWFAWKAGAFDWER